MYSAFRVQNFRCFEDLALTDLARINLIGGKNNTGKTSLLEAIFIHAGRVPQEVLIRLESNDADKYPPYSLNPTGNIPGWETLFRNFDAAFGITFDGTYGDPALSSQTQLRLTTIYRYQDFYKSSDVSAPNLPIHLQNAQEVLVIIHQDRPYLAIQHGTQVHHIGLPEPLFRIEYIKTALENGAFQKLFSNLIFNNQDFYLFDTLRLLEPRLQRMQFLYNLPYAHLESISKPIPLSAMGEGLNRLASIILALSDTQGGVLLIDEIENGLHHSVLTEVWRAIYQAAVAFNVQIFATTHSDEMIQAAQQAFTDDPAALRYYRLDRKKTGQIKAVMYAPEILETAILSDFEIRG